MGLDPSRVRALFDRFADATRDGDEANARALWIAAGWAENLTGGSGNTGASLHAQGHRKRWIVRPDLDRADRSSDDAWLVPCDIWSPDQARSLERVTVVVVRENDDPGQVRMLGHGSLEDASALARRWTDGERFEHAQPTAAPAETKKIHPQYSPRLAATFALKGAGVDEEASDAFAARAYDAGVDGALLTKLLFVEARRIRDQGAELGRFFDLAVKQAGRRPGVLARKINEAYYAACPPDQDWAGDYFCSHEPI